MKQSPEKYCSRCGFASDSVDMISFIWVDGSELFSLLLKEGMIRPVGSKYHFVEKPDRPDREELIGKISKILGHAVKLEEYSKDCARHEMLREARRLEITPWITSRAKFRSRRAKRICENIIEARKRQALRDALGESDSDGKSPDRNDPDMA